MIHDYANLSKTIRATDLILFGSLRLKVHVKFQLNPISNLRKSSTDVPKLKKNAKIMHNYANLCKTMHVNDTILLNSLCLNIKEVYVKF